jgi:hypothetical protein
VELELVLSVVCVEASCPAPGEHVQAQAIRWRVVALIFSL